MQTKPDIPLGLTTYAAGLTGGYPERYDAILMEAFSRHQLLLNAHALRQVAGGGSNSTAQAAIDRLRERLHEALSTRLQIGSAAPQSIVDAAGQFVDRLWVAAVGEAQAALADRAQEIEAPLAAANDRAQALELELGQARDGLEDLKTKFDTVCADRDRRTEQLQALESTLAQAKTQQEATSRQLQLLEAEHATALRHSVDLRAERDKAVEARQAEAQRHAQNLSQERQAMERERTLALDALRSEYRKEVARLTSAFDAERTQASVARERLAEATISLARTQQQLASEQKAAQAVADEMRERIAEGKRHADELRARLAESAKPGPVAKEGQRRQPQKRTT